jgi:hypothetical protein
MFTQHLPFTTQRLPPSCKLHTSRVVKCCLSYLFDFDGIHGPSEPISQRRRDEKRHGKDRQLVIDSPEQSRQKRGDLDSNESQLRVYSVPAMDITHHFLFCLMHAWDKGANDTGSSLVISNESGLIQVVGSSAWDLLTPVMEQISYSVRLSLFTASTMQQPCSNHAAPRFPSQQPNPWPERTGMLIAHRLSIVKRRSSSISSEAEVSRR